MSNENVRGNDVEARLLELAHSFSDSPKTNAVTEACAAAVDPLEDMNFSFSDGEDGVKVSDESIPVFRKFPVDVWMADEPDELQFAIRLLSSHVKSGVLPVWSAKSGVAFLFCPQCEMGRDAVPHVFEISNPDVSYRRCCRDIEDELYDKGAQRRIFVFPSGVLKDRSVLLCQTRSETIQLDNKEPMVDAVLSCLNGSAGRHVFFLSPLPSQFGVLKAGTWWDGMSANGKMHFVLCNLCRLKCYGHDASSPIEGAVCNFQKLRENFYPDAWWHICEERMDGKFETGKELLAVLLSSQNEGGIGRLKAYRLPSPLKQSVSQKMMTPTIGGEMRLAHLRLRLHAEEWVLKSLSQNMEPVKSKKTQSTPLPYPPEYLSVLEDLNCACTTPMPSSAVFKKDERDFVIALRTELEHYFEGLESHEGKLKPIWEWSFDYLVGRLSRLMVAQLDKTSRAHYMRLVSSSAKEMRATAFYREIIKTNDVDTSLEQAFNKMVEKLDRIRSLLIFVEKILVNNGNDGHSLRSGMPDVKDDFEGLLMVLNSVPVSALLQVNVRLASEISRGLKQVCSRAKPGGTSKKALELANSLVNRYEKARREVVVVLFEKTTVVKHSPGMMECLSHLGDVVPEIVLKIVEELGK